MVKGYARDHRQIRRDDIRAVQTASKPYLYHGDIDLIVREPFEGHAGSDLEKGQAQGIHVRLVTAKEVVDILLRDQFDRTRPGNPHTLAEVHQVRRGVEAGPQTAG